MKRTLSLVLALVMVLGMIPVYAQAATPQEEAGKLLEQLGVLKGDQNGNLMLDKTLLRRDAVVMLARLLGEEEVAAKYPTAPTWKDVTIKYYVPFLGWAQAEGYYKGYNDAKFGFTDEITVQDYAQVLLRALGYTDVEWKDAYTKAKDLGLLEGVTLEATAKLPRGNMSVMTVTALNTKVKDSEKTLAETLGIEMPAEFAVTAKATGAKKITVTFNKPVDKTKAVITVNKGSIAVNTESIVFADDAKSAVITTVTNLTKGDYTVKVTGLTDEALTATFSAEDVKVSKIELLSDKAPMTAQNASTAKVSFVVLNQYGERMNNVSVNWTASTGYTGSVSTGNSGVGEITIQNAAGAQFIPGTTVYLTGVHTQSATVINTQVQIVLPSHVDEVVFAGVAKNNKFVALPSGFTNADNYVLLFTAKDQYGNPMTVTSTNGAFSDILFVSNNPIFVGSTFTAVDSYEVDGVTYQGVKISAGSNTAAGGTAIIQAISARTGKVSSYTITADALPMLKTLTLSAPTTIVAEGETVEIPFTAYDQYGNPVTKFAALNGKVTLSDHLSFVEKPDGSAKLVYTAPTTGASDNQDLLVSLTSIVTATGNYSNVMVNVKEAAKPVVVTGLKSTIPTSVAQGNTVTISYGNILVQDQYGRTMNGTSNASKIGTIKVTVPSPSAFELKLNNVATTSASITTGSITLTAKEEWAGNNSIAVRFELEGVADSAKTVTFTRVPQSQFKSYEVGEIGKLYSGNSSVYAREVVVYGVTENGTKVKLPSGAFEITVPTGLATSSPIEIFATTDAALGLSATTKEVTRTIIVSVKDSNVSGSYAQVLSKDVVITNVEPTPTTITLVDDVVNGKAYIQVSTTTNASITASALYAFVDEVLDQYDVVVPTTSGSIIITDVVKVDGSAFTVSGNGTTNVAINGVSAGDKFTATYRYGNITAKIEFTTYK